MFEVKALPHAAQFDIEVALNSFERDFFAGIADRELNFAKAADADATLDRISLKRLRTAGVRKSHAALFLLSFRAMIPGNFQVIDISL